MHYLNELIRQSKKRQSKKRSRLQLVISANSLAMTRKSEDKSLFEMGLIYGVVLGCLGLIALIMFSEPRLIITCLIFSIWILVLSLIE